MKEMVDDTELLRRYATDRSEAAFAELVQRHINSVYRAALRQAGGNIHRAEDVTQTVFTILARKASSLTRHPALIGWLYTTTHFTMSELLRSERRRTNREQRAQAMGDLSSDEIPNVHWDQMRPVLDEAMRDLSPIDREVILLRFFEGMPFAAVGAKLSLREDTARMRLTRALERLRDSFVKRGIVSSMATVTAFLATEAESSAPAGLAANVTSTALASAAVGSSAAGSLGTAAVLAILTLGTAFYEFKVNQRAQMELAVTNNELAAASGQLRALKLTVQATEQTRSALLAATEAFQKASSIAPDSWDPRAEGRKFLTAFPQARLMMMQASVPGILKLYAPFIRNAHLTPEQTDQFEGLIASTWINNLGISPTQSLGALGHELPLAQLNQLLGVQGAHDFEVYELTMRYPYAFIENAAAAAAVAGSPLSCEQTDKIAQVIANKSAPYGRGLNLPSYNAAVAAVDWGAAIAEIQATLPPAQFSAIEGELQHMQYIGEKNRAEQGQAQRNP